MDGKEKIWFKWKSKAKDDGVFMLEYCFKAEWILFGSFSQSLSFFQDSFEIEG